VQAALLKARTECARGPPTITERQAVGEFLVDWLGRTARPSIRPSTFRGYSQTDSLIIDHDH
jgi:hypothetical protein